MSLVFYHEKPPELHKMLDQFNGMFILRLERILCLLLLIFIYEFRIIRKSNIKLVFHFYILPNMTAN